MKKTMMIIGLLLTINTGVFATNIANAEAAKINLMKSLADTDIVQHKEPVKSAWNNPKAIKSEQATMKFIDGNYYALIDEVHEWIFENRGIDIKNINFFKDEKGRVNCHLIYSNK